MPAPKKRAVRPVAATAKDDEDDVAESSAARKKGAPAIKPSDFLRAGFTGAQETMDSTSSFAQAFKPEEKAMVIKFLDDEPYVSYRRHWVERMGPDRKKITRSYTCLRSFKKECPLCEAGDRAQAVAAFNIAIVGDDSVVSLKSWDVGPKIYNILKGYANDPKIAPLTRGYFLVSRTGTKGSVNHNVTPVKPSALEEDYDITPPPKEDFDALEKYDADIIDVPTSKTMQEIAAEIADEYT
jgi:hypothetical protein